jgi:transcriptional regulator with XRE-family HTH domain
MKFGAYLKREKITTTDFAARIGVTHASVVRYVHGQRTPRIQVIDRIERATNGEVTMKDFLPPDDDEREAA